MKFSIGFSALCLLLLQAGSAQALVLHPLDLKVLRSSGSTPIAHSNCGDSYETVGDFRLAYEQHPSSVWNGTHRWMNCEYNASNSDLRDCSMNKEIRSFWKKKVYAADRLTFTYSMKEERMLQDSITCVRFDIRK